MKKIVNTSLQSYFIYEMANNFYFRFFLKNFFFQEKKFHSHIKHNHKESFTDISAEFHINIKFHHLIIKKKK